MPRVSACERGRELPADLAGTVGVTAGASAPDELVTAVVARLAPVEGVEEVRVTDEDEYFPPPPEFRDLLRGLAAALVVGLAAPPEAGESAGGRREDGEVLGSDRLVSAADVLARLAG